MYFLEGSHLSYPELYIKIACYGQIGSYVGVHVLFITNYVKYITYFKESILPNWSHIFLYNSIMLKWWNIIIYNNTYSKYLCEYVYIYFIDLSTAS